MCTLCFMVYNIQYKLYRNIKEESKNFYIYVHSVFFHGSESISFYFQMTQNQYLLFHTCPWPPQTHTHTRRETEEGPVIHVESLLVKISRPNQP